MISFFLLRISKLIKSNLYKNPIYQKVVPEILCNVSEPCDAT